MVSKMSKKILAALKKMYPAATCELNYKKPLQLLIATILSAQCTDKRVNMVTPALFQKYRTADDFAKAKPAALEKMIHSTGFYKNKAKSIQRCCSQLVTEFQGKIPEKMEELTKLAGVGRKTAHVIRGYAFGKPAMIVDTHVLRVSHRLGLTKEKNPDKVEAELCKLMPEKSWTDFCTHLLWHGRYCCKARKPECHRCPIEKLCPSSELQR